MEAGSWLWVKARWRVIDGGAAAAARCCFRCFEPATGLRVRRRSPSWPPRLKGGGVPFAVTTTSAHCRHATPLRWYWWLSWICRCCDLLVSVELTQLTPLLTKLGFFF